MTQLSRPQTSAGGGETVKVVVRCRPLSQTEIAQGHRRILSTDPKRGLIEVENPKESEIPAKCFTFDSVYDENSKQIDLYVETFRELVDSVLNGFNGTIFAYGQTGTGKTFTMEGARDNAELRGVIPNAIDHIFQHISQSKNQQYLVRASYLEIYQEEIRDLLDKDSKKRLELKERPDIGVYVKDLSSFVTKSVREIEHVMSVGHSNRSVGRTNMNEHSSRSHAIFIITIECSEVGPDGQSHIRVGRLNLVDLAGSERQTKAGTVGERFKEATKINLSLSALGNVISALVDGKSSHVPYRDSKLTRLLQDSLGGNSKTVMVANIGPASYNYDETLGTLRYASRAKNIKNQPKINEDPKDALLREFQDEINRLKGLLDKRTGSASSNRRRRRHKQADDGREDEGIEEINSEDYVREQQLKLEAEREQLMRNNTIVEEEKRRMLVELEDRAHQLAKEREAQAAVAAKIRAMQSKLLSGDGNLLDQTRKQQEILQQRRIELAEQKRREREVAQRLEAQEDNTAEIKQTFANLQQEIEAKSRKLQKFLMKHQQIRLEMQDSVEANSKERQSLESSVSEMNKELKLKWMLIENFIPMDVVEHLKERAFFDEDEEKWVIMKTGENSADNKSKTDSSSSSTSNAFPNMRLAESETRQSNSGNATRAMVDSGMDTGTSDVSSSHEFPSNRIFAAQLRRPVSMVGLRRPMCTSERVALERLRQRCHRSTSTNSIISPTTNAPIAGKIPAPSCVVLEEVARFACENLLTFDRLIYYPSQVHSSSELSSSSLAGESSIFAGESPSQNVVIDTSRIPIPRSASRGSRSGSARRNSSTSSSLISKNVRARRKGDDHISAKSEQPIQHLNGFPSSQSNEWYIRTNSGTIDTSQKYNFTSEQSFSKSSRTCDQWRYRRRKALNRNKRKWWLYQTELNAKPLHPEKSSPSPFHLSQNRPESFLSLNYIGHNRRNSLTSINNIQNETKEHDDINPNSTCFSIEHINDTNSIVSQEESACMSSLSTNDDPLVFHEKILNLDCSVLAAIENTRAKEWRNPAKRRPQSKIPTLMVRSLNDKSASIAKRNDRHSIPLTTMSSSMNIPESASLTFSTQTFDDRSSSGSCEQMALDGFLSPLQESRAFLSRIHQKSSSRPRTYYSPRALTQPLNSGEHSNPPSRKLSSQCVHSRNDFICQSSNGVVPIRECDKYKNSFGGWIVPIEKKVRLYKNPLSKCWLCRFDSAVLRRIKRRLTLRAENSTKKLSAPNKLCRRDPCRCSAIYSNSKSKYVSTNAGNESGILSTLFPMDYAVILAMISLIFHLVDLVFFANSHKEFCSLF